MHKKALRDLCLFWIFLLGCLGYMGLILFMASIHSAVPFIVLMLLPAIVGVSFIVYYSAKEEHELEEKQAKKRKRNSSKK